MVTSNPLQILRSTNPATRPTGRSFGEIYWNETDKAFGIINQAGTAQDLVVVGSGTGGPFLELAGGTVVGQINIFNSAPILQMKDTDAVAGLGGWTMNVSSVGSPDSGTLYVAPMNAAGNVDYTRSYFRMRQDSAYPIEMASNLTEAPTDDSLLNREMGDNRYVNVNDGNQTMLAALIMSNNVITEVNEVRAYPDGLADPAFTFEDGLDTTGFGMYDDLSEDPFIVRAGVQKIRFTSTQVQITESVQVTGKMDISGDCDVDDDLVVLGFANIGEHLLVTEYGTFGTGVNITTGGLTVTSGGADISGTVDLNSSSIHSVNEIQVMEGSSTDPSFTFTDNTGTGFYRDTASGAIRITVNNDYCAEFMTDGTTATNPNTVITREKGDARYLEMDNNADDVGSFMLLWWFGDRISNLGDYDGSDLYPAGFTGDTNIISSTTGVDGANMNRYSSTRTGIWEAHGASTSSDGSNRNRMAFFQRIS